MTDLLSLAREYLLSPRVRSRDVVNGDVPAYWKSILQRQWIQMGIWWEKGDCVVLPRHGSVLDEQFYETEWRA
jgi:hypothetical protein